MILWTSDPAELFLWSLFSPKFESTPAQSHHVGMTGAQRETELETLNKAKADLQTAHDGVKKELSESVTAFEGLKAENNKTVQRLGEVEAELESANQSIVTLLKQSEDKLQVPHKMSPSFCSMIWL